MTRVRQILGFVGSTFEKSILWASAARRSAVVLAYHRVSPRPDAYYPPTPPSVFRAHLDLIRRHFTIVELGDLVAKLRDGRSLRGYCAITFDDGFFDFLEHAYPILAELRIPATHFLTLDGLVLGRTTWNYRLNRALHFVALSDDLNWSPRGGAPPNMAELTHAKSLVDSLTPEEREALLERLEDLAEPSISPAMIRSEDVQRVDSSIIQWGSHTVTHSTLVGRSKGELVREMAQSRTELERILQRPVRFLAYPNGLADGLARRTAAECGYQASFLCAQRRVFRGTPLHEIQRLDVGGLPAAMFGLEVLGFTPTARRILRP